MWPFIKNHYAPSLDNLIISNWPYFIVDWSNGYGEKVLQLFVYSKLFLQLGRSCKLFNGLDDFKVALFVCRNHTYDDIHSDHSYLDTPGIPLNSTLTLRTDVNIYHSLYYQFHFLYFRRYWIFNVIKSGSNSRGLQRHGLWHMFTKTDCIWTQWYLHTQF